MKKDFLAISDVTRKDVLQIFQIAKELKEMPFSLTHVLENKSVILLFEKPSTRTRLSFQIGITHLGGNPVHVDSSTTQLGRGETIADTARVMDRYAHGIIARVFSHSSLEEMAGNFRGHVVNGLSDLHHPCQALADLFTISEVFGGVEGKNIAFVGNGNNNVTHSLMMASALLGANIAVACPKSLFPDKSVFSWSVSLAGETGAAVKIFTSPKKAVENVDVVYTDVWVSMGEEKKKGVRQREKLLRPFQVNSALLKNASRNVIVMHCLPAHRGKEITSGVIDGEKSVVFDQAENRLHVQKALLLRLIS